jgi:hypothetical protein
MTSEATPQVFMSYTRSDDEYLGGALTELRKALEKALHFQHGRSMTVFQDIEGIHLGQNIQQRLGESLNETLLLLPIITPSYLQSAWCREEFTRFLERERALGRNDLIIPIYYHKVNEIEAARPHPTRAQPASDPIVAELVSRLAADWHALRGKPLEDPQVSAAIERVAERIIQVINEIGTMTRIIGLFSYDPVGPGMNARTRLELGHHLSPDPEAPAFWQTILPRELGTLRTDPANANLKHLTLYAKAHLSVGVAFGYTFRSTTDVNISIEQRGQWWHTGACPAEASPLVEELEPVDPAGTDLTVEISAVKHQRAEGGVNQWIAEQQPSPRQRLHLYLPNTDTDEVRDAEHALAIACQVRAAILRARRQHMPQKTHLFGVMPVGLAVLVGWLLNTCEPVQCYDFNRETQRYYPTCYLTRAFATAAG